MAVVHEWFASIGGSENVAGAMLEAFPGSKLYCLWRSEGASLPEGTSVTESRLASKPFRGRKMLSLPLMPLIWRSASSNLKNADVVLISSHLFAHHMRVPDRTKKLVYVHTPARYIWEPHLDQRGDGPIAKFASTLLKPLDRYRAQEAIEIAANSHFVRDRIRRAWNRDSRVIYPPVDVEEIQSREDWSDSLSADDRAVFEDLPSEYILGASRFVSYKRLDVVIRAGEISGIPVVLAGSGPEDTNIRKLAATASVPVKVINRPSTHLLRALYQHALLYVFPPIEDFGIMPVEAMASGTPVLANRVGGASESVIEGVTGALFDPSDMESLADGISSALALDRRHIPDQMRHFSRQRFKDELKAWVREHS